VRGPRGRGPAVLDDAEEYRTVRRAMDTMGLGPEDQGRGAPPGG